jgi:tetratricopeptide (TPR) repeat protein
MADGVVVKLDEQELLTFVMRCFQWSNADVFAMGRRDSISRLGEIAAYIGNLNGKEQRPAAQSLRIVLPPAGGRDPDAMRAEVKEGVRRAFRRFEPDDETTAAFVDALFDRIKIDQAADFTMGSLEKLLTTTADREAVVVGEVAHYRSDAVALPGDDPRLPEDVWSAHLHVAMLLAEEKAKASGSYVLLDIGQSFPARDANMELLRSAGDVGLCGVANENEITPDEMIATVAAAYDAAAAGDIGGAVSLVDTNEKLSDRQKWMMRLAVLERGGARDEVSRILDESAATINELKSEDHLGLARIATGIDRDDYAQNLIERALPGLMAANDLEAALEIARETRRRPLIERARERLRQLHPGSHLLRSVDGREAARDGDYAKAADLLSGSPDERERTIGGVFRLLAEGVAGEGFTEPAKLAEDLATRMPDWKADFQREIILSLEREGRRDEAVAMLLSDDVVWDETWFVFARGLMDRSLASGSAAVGPNAMTRMIDVGAAYIAENPAAGLARTSVSDLLDAEHVGVGGIAVMMMNVVERAARQADAETGEDGQQKRMEDIGRLPAAMGRVLKWLQAKGSGVIVPGRDAAPAGVLREDPDAALHGLLRMVDHHAPEPDDPVEEALLRNFVTMAIAIAPAAVDSDADLPVLRGAAIKAIVSGRPQLARDLAEQVLLVAGDRPARRRCALTAFADIYARVGRLREALLMLAAAFELPSSRTWREMWEEQSVLLRMLRDVNMAEEAIRIIDRLRSVSAKVAGAEGYTSRLDTLELHAQLRRRQTGTEGAWSTDRLLDEAIANGKTVLEAGDEALPGAILLRQLIDRAELEDVEVPTAAMEMLDRLCERLAPPYRTLVEAASRQTDTATVATVAGPIGSARYNEDVSYDLRLARTMAGRLARNSVDKGDPEGFAYTLELLSAQGVGVRGAGPEVKAAERILADPKAPLGAAVEIAKRGVPIVGMAFDDRGLMMMTVNEDGPHAPVMVDAGTFDPTLLRDWSRSFPYGYFDPKLGEDGFRDATARLGLPDIPNRAIVLSGDLSSVPPNVLTIDGNLAGLTRSIATTPSLSWLKASLASTRNGDGSAAAWIPIAAGGSDTDTLSLMVEDVRDVLDAAKIALHTQSSAPVSLASADLAIIGAHGGLAEGNRYFRGLSDDQHQPADLRQVVDVLKASRVALLFVCSGGRLDQHPESCGLVGIAHRLLDKGLDAVVAPSWPIPFLMVRPWLGGFLKAWDAGSPVLDACGAGNAAVRAATSSDLARSLAMSIYGNPFVTR